MEIPTLTFGNYTLRALREEDVAALTRLHSDPDVMRYLSASGQPEVNPRDAWNYIALHLGHWRLKGCGKWALADRSTDALIGRVGYFDPPFDWPGLELGWTIAREFWGKGIARHAAQIALEWGMSNLDAPEIISAIIQGNERSVRVAKRLEMKLKQQTILHGRPCEIYAMTREAWRNSKGMSA